MKKLIYEIPTQKGITVMTGAIKSLSGNSKDYILYTSNDYCHGKIAVLAKRIIGSSETIITLCKTSKLAQKIIDNLTHELITI